MVVFFLFRVIVQVVFVVIVFLFRVISQVSTSCFFIALDDLLDPAPERLDQTCARLRHGLRLLRRRRGGDGGGHHDGAVFPWKVALTEVALAMRWPGAGGHCGHC